MEWRRGPTIGRGSSAVVSLATTAAGHVFAVKSAGVSSSCLLQSEQCLISQLCSPFIVKCFGSDVTWEDNKRVYNLFLEYVAGGTLSDLIRSQGGGLDESVMRFYTHQMLQGLNYLHLKGVVHCDIKGQNVLIGKDGLKIADFGCAKWSGSAVPAFAGTPAYMAPEVARGEEQSFPADVWALGCTVIEMATGSNPWPEMKDPASALYRVAYSDDVPEFPIWFSDCAKDFLSKCLMRDPKERWTAAELLQHPFLNSVEVNCGEIREFTRKSPTSVMDQGFWDALEVPDSSPNPTDIASSSDSPTGRIRGLVGDALSPNLNLPVWTEEEDWMTVRANEAEELSKVHDDSENKNQDCGVFSSINEEEIQTPVAVGDSFFNSFPDEISIVDVINFPVGSRDSGADDSVSRNVILKKTVTMGGGEGIRVDCVWASVKNDAILGHVDGVR
ncbi:UNVERIFIED_CONTAM: Mitogen-activated protein kinase kinase kinase [Sesamum angustifolium]|uniref:Mitogen-activated protein kinase kinase kinase n=1 Tax=Sesamum angustifolium TaxID=2727405 RepID=A0AAW2PC14_9LAMI